MRAQCLFLIAGVSFLLFSGCWLDRSFKHRGPTTPKPLDDGWAIGTPEEVGLSRQALEAIHDELLSPDRWMGTLGILVIKDGKLVFETYVRDLADRDRVHHIQSSTKSVTSILFGIATDQGWMPAVDTPLCSILSDSCIGLDVRKQAITLEHLLTMRSGLDFMNDEFAMEMWVDKPSHPIHFILDKPLYADPGSKYLYRDADPQLIGYALQALLGQTEEDFAKHHLFGPLDIRDYYWDRGAGGETMAAHGLHLRPRDLAKIGQLMLDEGKWQGIQVVSTAWHQASTTHKIVPLNRPHLGYGYYWWVVPQAKGYSTWGRGGQFAFVVPEKQLVLVLVSLPDTDGDSVHGALMDQFVDLTRPLWQAGP